MSARVRLVCFGPPGKERGRVASLANKGSLPCSAPSPCTWGLGGGSFSSCLVGLKYQFTCALGGETYSPFPASAD